MRFASAGVRYLRSGDELIKQVQSTPEDVVWAHTDCGRLSFWGNRRFVNLDGLVNDFEYLVSLPRKGEVTQTVEFTPRYWYTSLTHSSDACILDSLPHN